MKLIQKILLVAICLVSMVASAQWQWIDKDGRKVFSDRAPPSDILEKNILKRPGGSATAVPSSPASTGMEGSSVTVTTGPQGGASAPKSSGVDKELAEKKKKAEDAEAAKRKAEEERILKARIENCARAKQGKATFDSGVRVTRTNEKGEREVMDDVARAAEAKRIQAIIDSDCK